MFGYVSEGSVMSYYLSGTNVPININMISISGIGITGLIQSNINLTLMQSGITILNGVTGDYTFSQQSNGIYRIVLGLTLTSLSNVDYVLIAHDLTGQALDDKLEFTLYVESVDSAYTKLNSSISTNTVTLGTINNTTTEADNLLKDTTVGLAAIKNKENTIDINLANNTTSILTDVHAIPLNPVLTNDGRLNNLSNLDTTISSRSTLTTADLNNIKTPIIAEVDINKTKIDTLTTNVANNTTSILTGINSIPTTTVLSNDSRLNNLSNLDTTISSRSTLTTADLNNIKTPIIAEVDINKTKIDTLTTNVANNTNSILNEVISQATTSDNKIDSLTSLVTNSTNTIVADINLRPINPILDSNPIVARIDTPISTRSSLTDQQVWAYSSRQLTGVSGINQLNVNNFTAQFKVNTDLYLDAIMLDTNTNPVTGYVYPTDLNVILYKNGIKQTLSTVNIAVSGLEEGFYRVKIDKSLLDLAGIDYALIIKDIHSVAKTYRTSFSLYDAVGIEGAYQASITINDINTNLAIPDTQVYVKNSDQSLLINKGISGVDGKYIVGLGAGTYKLILKKAFTDFVVPQTMTVSSSGTNTFTYYGSGFSASNPTSPSTCVLYGWVSDLSGKFIKGATIVATEPTNSRFMGTNKIVKTTKSTTTNSLGYFELELIRSSLLLPSGLKYTIDITYTGFSYSKQVSIPNAATVEFSTL